MKQEIIELLNKILDSDLSREAKEKIVLYYMLPSARYADAVGENLPTGRAPIEKEEGRVGAIHRPDKKDLDMKNNPALREETEAMKETLDKIPDLNE